MKKEKTTKPKTKVTKKTSTKKTTTTKKSTTKKVVNSSKKTPINKKKEAEIKEPTVEKNKSIKSIKLNKKFILFIVIALILVLGIASILIANYKNRDIDTITLETHANEIYEWKHEIADKKIVKFYKKQRSGDLRGTTEEGLIIEKYLFKALKPGKTTIEFTFMNAKNGSYGEIKYYKVTVTDNLKLIIEEDKK